MELSMLVPMGMLRARVLLSGRLIANLVEVVMELILFYGAVVRIARVVSRFFQ